ncbi:MAG: ABC transporter substrate-binding protein [Gammaproteobacteria bacterium]
MKKILITAAAVAVVLAVIARVLYPSAFDQRPTVAVSQIVEHPALDDVRKGILDGLAEAGYKDGENFVFKFQTAQGNPAIAAQIARQFVGEEADVLVGIATPSAQALANATKDIPIVFSAVTDPVGAKLLTQMEKPDGNVTGLSDLSPVGQHVELMAKIAPNVKTIGVVYNPGEANAVSLVELLRAEAAKRGYEVAEATASRTAEVKTAATAAADKSQILYAITDNTVASAIAAMTGAADAAGIPVFGATADYVEKGAVASVGFDYYQVGLQTAEYVAAILGGKTPAQLPAKVAKGTDIVINPAAAKKLGITLPAELTANPSRIVQ